ncbi:hypothetical protein [Microbacterium sp. A84]|uniref:hypothetical protein n=1 Tax=Microbacterium sp. A84 TaxID=3450715 RepID=UPI003F43B963
MTTSVYIGPLSFTVLAVPAGADLTDAVGDLQRLHGSSTMEILDVEVIERGPDGTVSRASLADDGAAAEFGELSAVETELLDSEDIAQIGVELEQGERALVIVYEDRNLATVGDRIIALGGREVWSGGIDVSDLDADGDGASVEEES